MIHFENEHKEHHDYSALKVNAGIEQPPIVNPHYKRIKKRKMTVEQYVEGIAAGDIVVLGQAITLIESALEEHQAVAQQVLERCLPMSGKSVRIGITGVPGAGKSTFIEAIGSRVVEGGRKLAVLAIDPSSQRSKGSILGDKTRMETITNNKNVFIRPSPSGNSLGGVARKTRETLVLCEAAGFDTIFIETVGVGQSETAVHSMVDLFLMLQISGAGDELQGIKRGIMEMADLVAITKADGTNVEKAALTKAQIENALMLFPTPDSGLHPKVFLTSAYDGTGLEELWDAVTNFLQQTGNFEHNRARQSRYWIYETVDDALRNGFYRNEKVEIALKSAEQRVQNNELSPFTAAHQLLELYKSEQ